MKELKSENILVLGLAPSSYGCGFAVMKREGKMDAWGIKTVKSGNKNARSLSHVANLIARYHPKVVAIEDTRPKASRRSPRIRALMKKIVTLAKKDKIQVTQFSRKQVSLGLLSNERGTKHAVAQYLANRFPKELALRLPPKRRAWDNDDPRMDIFGAVALAEVFLRAK
jgi:Holliday junction resolvasome RuvABC endonuclease subunit